MLPSVVTPEVWLRLMLPPADAEMGPLPKADRLMGLAEVPMLPLVAFRVMPQGAVTRPPLAVVRLTPAVTETVLSAVMVPMAREPPEVSDTRPAEALAL